MQHPRGWNPRDDLKPADDVKRLIDEIAELKREVARLRARLEGRDYEC